MKRDNAILGSIRRLFDESGERDRAIKEERALSDEENNFFKGAGIVTMFSWIQYRCPKEIWEKRYRKPFKWEHWDEFHNFNYIRNTFAHSGDGNMSPEHNQSDIEGFLKEFKSKPTLKNMDPYYSTKDEKIILGGNALNRCRGICLGFLEHACALC